MLTIPDEKKHKIDGLLPSDTLMLNNDSLMGISQEKCSNLKNKSFPYYQKRSYGQVLVLDALPYVGFLHDVAEHAIWS